MRKVVFSYFSVANRQPAEIFAAKRNNGPGKISAAEKIRSPKIS
jgi:hypothetical protein